MPQKALVLSDHKCVTYHECLIFLGTLPNITRNALVNCTELVTYDMIKEAILRHNLMSGTVCVCASVVLTHPPKETTEWAKTDTPSHPFNSSTADNSLYVGLGHSVCFLESAVNMVFVFLSHTYAPADRVAQSPNVAAIFCNLWSVPVSSLVMFQLTLNPLFYSPCLKRKNPDPTFSYRKCF